MNVQGITSHSNTETLLHDPNVLLRFQQTLAEVAHRAETTEAALQAIVGLICEFTGWSVGHAQLVQHGSPLSSNIWHLESPRRHKPFVEAAKTDPSMGFAQQAVKDRKPVWIQNLATAFDSPWLRVAQEVDLQSGGAFPVYFGNDVVTVLEFYSSSPISPDEQLLQILRLVGSQLGPIIECQRTKQALHIAQVTLQEKEEKYQLLFEHSKDGIFLADQNGQIVFCNSRGREMLGYSAEELAGLNISDTYPPEELELAKQRMRDLRPGQTVEFERSLRRKDGTCLPVEIKLHAVEGWFQGIIRDISERKLAQTAVRESEEKYRRLIELSSDALFIHVQGRIALINSAGLRLLGAERAEQIIGKHILDLVHPDYRAMVQARIKKTQAGEPVSPLEEKYVRLDGTTVDVEVVAAPLTYLNQAAGQVIVRDITQRKQSAEKIDRERTLLRALIETIPDRIYVKDNEAHFILNNIAHIRALGATSQEEVKGKTDFDFRPADIAKERMADDQRVLKSGEALYNREEATIRADGKEGWNLVNKVPLRDAEGKVVGLVGISRDITERKRMEEKLLAASQSFEQLAAIVESSDDAITGKTLDGVITSWNPAAERIYGYTTAEAIGQPVTFLMPPDHIDEMTQILERIRRGESVEHYETARITKDGRRITVSLTISPIKDSAGRIIGASAAARDITEHKRIEEEMDRDRTLLRALIETIPDRIYAKDTEARFILNNAAHLLALGAKSQQETTGKTDFDFRPAEVASKCMTDDQEVIQSGQPLHNREEPTKLADGKPGWILVNKVPLRDPEGNIVGLVGISRDITARKEADEKLKVYAARLERSNRDLQDFAYIASHDLQEPLRKIQAFGDRLKAKYNDVLGETGQDYLARMFDAAARMQTLINDLLSFSRVTTKAQPFAPVDLDKILREVLSDLEVRIEQTHGRVEAAPLGTIDADALQMRQLFQNLIGNALKFHKEGESPVIRIQGRRTEDSPSRIEITFVDNGIGFDQKYADRIFVIFQRLHGRSQYEGTGVGLAVCMKIAVRHGGSITAESKEGEGATFRVVLPINHSNGEETT